MDLNIPKREYSHESFISEIRRLPIRNFSLLYYFVNLDYYRNKEDFLALFKYGENIIESYGDIDKITMNVRYRNIDKIVYFYIYFDKINSIILAYTLANSDDIDESIIKVIKRSFGTYYIPINFTAFLKLTNYLTNRFSNVTIPFFVAVHYPTFKTKGLHRSDVKRTINYWGDDGLKTMNELKEYYGMLPRVIKYKVKKYGTYLITNKGKFTLENRDDVQSSWSLFFDIVNYVIQDMLTYKNIISKSEYKIIPYSTDHKVFNLPTAVPWIVEFSNSLDDGYLKDLVDEININHFTLFNTSTFYGNSFALSSMVYDEDKNNIFSIDIDNNKITVIPYERNILESFLRLYEVISDFDPESQLVGI